MRPLLKKRLTHLETSDVQEYRALCIEAMIDFLNFEKQSKFYLIDPSGKLALRQAAQLRRELKKTPHASAVLQKKLLAIKQALKQELFQKAYHQKWVAHQ